MTGQIVLRRTPLLSPAVAPRPEHHPRCRRRKKVEEVAGGAAADCAVLCCCCPCGLLKLLILAFYRLPAGLWRKTGMRRRRRKKKKKKKNAELGGDRPSPPPPAVEQESPTAGVSAAAAQGAADAMGKEEDEMWDRFYSSTGFWRSLSRRDT